MLAEKLKPLLKPDDIIWIHDYHLIPFAEACRMLGIRNRIGFFLHIPFPAPEILTAIPPHNELLKTFCYYDLIGFQTDTDRLAFQDYITREVRGVIEPDGSLTAYGRTSAPASTRSAWCRTRSSSWPPPTVAAGS